MPTTESITVKRTENIGNYSNRIIEEKILLNEGEDPDEERRKLSLKIERSLHEDTYQQVKEEIRTLREEKNKINSEISGLREQLSRYKNVLETHRDFIESANDVLKATIEDIDSLPAPRNISDLVIADHEDDDEDYEDYEDDNYVSSIEDDDN